MSRIVIYPSLAGRCIPRQRRPVDGDLLGFYCCTASLYDQSICVRNLAKTCHSRLPSDCAGSVIRDSRSPPLASISVLSVSATGFSRDDEEFVGTDAASSNRLRTDDDLLSSSPRSFFLGRDDTPEPVPLPVSLPATLACPPGNLDASSRRRTVDDTPEADKADARIRLPKIEGPST